MTRVRNGINRHRAKFLLAFGLAILTSGSASAQMNVPTIPQIPAFLPTADSVPATQAMPLDGTWIVNTIQKKIRIEAGRAYAVDGWLHLFVLDIQPGMVVIKDIAPTAPGEYTGQDLPLVGNWTAKVQADRSIAVSIAGILGPASYRLIPVQLDNPQWYNQEMQAAGLGASAPGQGTGAPPAYGFTPPPGSQGSYVPEPPSTQPQAPAQGYPAPNQGYQPTPQPGYPQGPQQGYRPTPPAAAPSRTVVVPAGGSLMELGRNCYEDFKPMGVSMLKYAACQKGLGRINALKSAIKAHRMDDVQGIIEAAACKNELTEMVNTFSRKGFRSFSLGVSGEVSAGISGTGEYLVAMDLDLSNPTLYASVGGGIGVQLGGSVDGVVSTYYAPADRLSGSGKSFSVALEVMGGAGASVGLSSGRSPRCESFSASAGVGGLANTGSISVTQTVKLIDIPKPDFTPACEDVTVRATNRTGREIKIIDVDFYDYQNGHWRSNAIKNKKVASGGTWSKQLRLQKVGGDRTKVRIQYRVKDEHSLLNPWSKVINRETGDQTCRKGTTFSASLN